MSRHELDELFEEATSTSSPVLQHIKARSPALDALLNHQLPTLFETLLAYERKRAQVHRVDGLIIGTGEADFTKGNTLYPLSYKGKRFQLIDVPGIEGDEWSCPVSVDSFRLESQADSVSLLASPCIVADREDALPCLLSNSIGDR